MLPVDRSTSTNSNTTDLQPSFAGSVLHSSGSQLAGAEGLEPTAFGFGDRRSTN